MGKKAAGGFYAVGKGRQTGIYHTWAECESNVKGFPDAKFKKFTTQSEAEDFVRQWQSAPSRPQQTAPLPNQSSSSGLLTSNPGISYSKRSLSSAVSLYNADKRTETLTASKRRLEQGTKLLDSPVTRSSTKKLRVDSPQTKGIDSLNGEVTYLPFNVDSDGYVNVFTDGACLQNGRSNPKAGVGVWFGDDHPLNISEPVVGPPTNNTAEIQAARLAIEMAKKAGFERLRINTDSAFLIQCATSWMHKWKSNGWKLATGGDVKNRVELEKLDIAQRGIVVQWTKVAAHCGIHGNEMADKLAGAGALKY